MGRRTVISAIVGGFLVFSLSAAPVLSREAAVPARQLSYAHAGVRVTLTDLAVGRHADAMTLTVENDRASRVYIAALFRRSGGGLQAVLTDSGGGACAAADVIGVRKTPDFLADPRLSHSASSMTTVPPRSRRNAVFRFRRCRLSSPPLSFAAEFALATGDGKPARLTVPFWGIVPRQTGAGAR